MKIFAERLKQRAKELGISNAEAARRCGLGERRYGNYVTGAREPDLATLVKIATALNASLDYLLGATESRKQSSRELQMDRLTSAASTLSDSEIAVVVKQVEALANHTDGQP